MRRTRSSQSSRTPLHSAWPPREPHADEVPARTWDLGTPTRQLSDGIERQRRHGPGLTINEDAEQDVIKLLERERSRLDALAHALLERETLDQPEAYEVAGVGPPETPSAERAEGDGRAPRVGAGSDG